MEKKEIETLLRVNDLMISTVAEKVERKDYESSLLFQSKIGTNLLQLCTYADLGVRRTPQSGNGRNNNPI